MENERIKNIVKTEPILIPWLNISSEKFNPTFDKLYTYISMKKDNYLLKIKYLFKCSIIITRKIVAQVKTKKTTYTFRFESWCKYYTNYYTLM